MPYLSPESQPPKPKRRRFTVEQKQAIVGEARAPGASVSRVARAHDLNTNQVFKWMREAQRKPHAQPTMPSLIPVLLGHAQQSQTVLPASVTATTGSIELHFLRGRVCLNGTVDPGTLRIILECLAT